MNSRQWLTQIYEKDKFIKNNRNLLKKDFLIIKNLCHSLMQIPEFLFRQDDMHHYRDDARKNIYPSQVFI